MKTETVFSNDGEEFLIWIGENALDNWCIIDKSEKHEIWIHLNDRPSSHVIIKCKNNKVPIDVIKKASFICKQNSKAYKNEKLKVSYTTIENVKKTKITGEVILKNYNISKFTV